ncbi:flavoprotein [Streptomyces sp. NPDC046324]|uniref:flavoprotein n=1 Tax=Streptomyces sp. NPDC046324 TaxID=3154915 RepID=UPI00340BD6AC
MKPPVRHLLLGVSGSSAASGLALLLDEAAQYAQRVTIVATPTAREHFLPDDLPVPVFTDSEWRTSSVPLHMQLLEDTDLFVVAPTTATTMARVAAGLADNLLAALVLAHGPGVYFQPSMNLRMWQSHTTRRNVGILRDSGHLILPATPTPTLTSNAPTGVGPIPGTVFASVFGRSDRPP